MDKLSETKTIIAEFFNVNYQSISEKTNAEDIAEWDSFSHMELMTKIEEHFNCKIPFTELMDFQCIGDIIKYLEHNK